MTATLITGANKGLGFETARRLIAAGHTVYVGSRDAERGHQAAEQLGARAVQLDVTDDTSVQAAVAVIEADGGLDVLVNNAGIATEWRDTNVMIGAADVTAEVMRQTFETNVFGTVRILHAFLPMLRRSTAPVVVNVSSGLASLTRVTTLGHSGVRLLGCRLPGVEDRGQHDHRAVREGVPEHADQRGGTGLHQDRSEWEHRPPQLSSRAPRSSCAWRRWDLMARPEATSTPKAPCPGNPTRNHPAAG